ncbi:hexosaminidase D-like, partial [Tachyglossus aculeatus]|uniref:hexosaminidase D-like n=1 Tax=Tachyglossus aculeatus TaxID=9261 RepID=UPI0018F33935
LGRYHISRGPVPGSSGACPEREGDRSPAGLAGWRGGSSLGSGGSVSHSEDDVEKLQQLAARNKLAVIPLVQTFGHVEFILKHERFQHLREVARYPNSLNPHAPGTWTLLRALLTQVMDRHRQAHWLHIGADEVFHLGEGVDSKTWLGHHGRDVDHMYLGHIREVVTFLTGRYPGLRLLLWDDMLRKIPAQAIRESGITQHAAPVLWFYTPDLDTEQIGKIITKYAESGFSAVWFASAFKGTTGPAQIWTPLSHHLKNHLSWLKVIQAMAKFPTIQYQGIVLTGWQRYDHFSVLCELLPVGIPSLALCLQTLVNGGFTDITKKRILELLGFQNIHLEQSTCEGTGSFPGSEIYHMVEQVNVQLKEKVLKVLEEESAIKGWFSRYHRRHRFGNPRNLDSFGSKLIKTLEEWESFVQGLRAGLEAVFFPDAVEEWLDENVNVQLEPLRELVHDYREVIQLNGRPKTR